MALSRTEYYMYAFRLEMLDGDVIEVHIVIMISDSAQMPEIHKEGLTKFRFSGFVSRLSRWIVESNQWRRESIRSIFAEQNKSTRVHRVDKNQQYWTLSRHWAHLSLYIRYVKILFIFEKEKEKVDCWYNRIFFFISFILVTNKKLKGKQQRIIQGGKMTFTLYTIVIV